MLFAKFCNVEFLLLIKTIHREDFDSCGLSCETNFAILKETFYHKLLPIVN